MATRKKKPSAALAPNPDPTTPLDGAALVAALQPVRKALEEDLLTRATKSPALHAALTRRHAEEQQQERTADPFPVWRRAYVEQVAAAWILSVVFVRTLEDRWLLAENRIAGPGAADAQRTFLELAPSLSEREYLLTVFREMSRLPAAAALFDHHDLAWSLAPSADGAKALLQFFRAPTPEAPAFRFGQRRVTPARDADAHAAKAHAPEAHVSEALTSAPSGLHDDTRFLGDLYQDLNENVRKRYALLQTPDFVEAFLLDRTLEPAIEHFGLPDTTLIDPTCGSGHFLLGAFHRLVERHRHHAPGISARDAALRALDAVHGTDINPYAVAIAKFRLTLAFLDVAGFRRLADAPALPLHVAVADSLLYNPQRPQLELGHREDQRATDWQRGLCFEDEGEARALLHRTYSVVVGNPPFIAVSDPALRESYRRLYESAAGKYTLSVPFVERFFQLSSANGFVGLMNSNAFLKRSFGKTLIEKVLPRYDLTLIVNTAWVPIPGPSIQTILLFGRGSPPSSPSVRAVLAIRGEGQTPDNPADSVVWRSIVDHWSHEGHEDEYISVGSIPWSELRCHPWSLSGGGAIQLKTLVESRSDRSLQSATRAIGVMAVSGDDEVYIAPYARDFTRLGIEEESIKPLGGGEHIRDWSIHPSACIYPHDQHGFFRANDSVTKFLWPYRTPLRLGLFFGKTKHERNLDWRSWSATLKDKCDTTTASIAFAEVATHNHFVLDRGGKVFKQTAPIIKLPDTATEDDHLALLAYLNSSTACFWIKQVAHQFGTTTADISKEKGRQDANRVSLAANTISPLPLPSLDESQRAQLADLARVASDEAAKLEGPLGGKSLAALVAASPAASPNDLSAELRARREESRAKLRTAQEDIDWLVYRAFGLVDTFERSEPTNAARPFEADDAAAHTPWNPRRELLRNSKQLRILETSTHKRMWAGRRGVFGHNVSSFEDDLTDGARTWMLDEIERALTALHATRTRASLTSALVARDDAQRVASLTPEAAAPDFLNDAIAHEAVPFLAAYRYTDTGLEKRAQWEETWDLQRREDAGEKIPNIPVPPRYDAKDFPSATYWRLRGKLDVPKERFISYPGCESDEDGEPLYGWAGWNHAERAEALVALYQDRKTRESWPKERLLPLLAGLLELLPWLHQWHDEPHPDYDTTIAEAYRAFLQTELRTHDLTEEDLRTWRPSGKSGGKKAGKKPAKTARKSRSPQALEDVSASTSDERADE